jgi:hypothetical protein
MVKAEAGTKWFRHVPLEAINGKLQLAATVVVSSFLLAVRARDPRNQDARTSALHLIIINLYLAM